MVEDEGETSEPNSSALLKSETGGGIGGISGGGGGPWKYASSFQRDLTAFMGGMVHTIIAPIERAKLLLQTQESNLAIVEGSHRRFRGMFDCIIRTVREEGFVSLWRGNGSSVLRYYPSVALNFSLKLLLLLAVSHGIVIAGHGSAADRAADNKQQPYRTAFHFQPLQNWMNDPNGPMYYKGVYHLFYQYNPYSAIFGNMTWGHAISYDLINWAHLQLALLPTDPYDQKGCWSGSATTLPNGKPVILYTGIDSNGQQVQNLATPKDPSDPFLREWTKSPQNPLLSPVGDVDPHNFRDPTTAWRNQDDGLWSFAVGGYISGKGLAILYHSYGDGFVNWTRNEKPLHSSSLTGAWECPDFYPVGKMEDSGRGVLDGDDDSGSGGPGSSMMRVEEGGGVSKYVLKASFNDTDHYVLGRYNSGTFEVETDFYEGGLDLRYDYGMFYASKTFFDGRKERRILWGWIRESDSTSDDIQKGWSGLQCFPRVVWLSEDGNQLIQWPIKEIEALRGNRVEIASKKIVGGSLVNIDGVTASQADVDVSFKLLNLKDRAVEEIEVEPTASNAQLLCAKKGPSVEGVVGPFGLLVLASNDSREQTAVFFRVFKHRHDHDTNNKHAVVLMCSDQTRSSLRDEVNKTSYGAFIDIDLLRDEKISLRTLVDHSIVESFGGGGKACITARVYPKLAIGSEAKLYVFNNGTTDIQISKLSAWSMRKSLLADESSYINKRRSKPKYFN